MIQKPADATRLQRTSTEMKKTQVPLVLMVDYSIYISSRGVKLAACKVRGGRGQRLLQRQEQGARLAGTTCKHQRQEVDANVQKCGVLSVVYILLGRVLKSQLCQCDDCFCLLHLLPSLLSTNKPNPIIFVHGVPSKELLS